MAAPALPAALVIDIDALRPVLLVMTVLPAAVVDAVCAVGVIGPPEDWQAMGRD